MRRLFYAVLALSMLGIAAIQPSQPRSVHAQETTYQIGDQRHLTSDADRIFTISPDGERLVAVRDLDDEAETRLLCALGTAQLEELVCSPFDGRPGTESSAWSPDGTKVAFTEDVLFDGDDGDIWVFDTSSGAITNLTDDQYAGGLLRAPDNIVVDMIPIWSPDGAEIAFARSQKTGDDAASTTLYRISATGGEPREIARVAEEQLAVYTRLHWSEDDTIVYQLDQRDGPNNGLWRVSADGGTPTQLVSQDAWDGDLAFLLETSVLNQGLLMIGRPGSADLVVVDFATGEMTPIDPPGANPSTINAMTFSPDGTQLLLANRPDKTVDEIVLTIHTIETGAEQTLTGFNQDLGDARYRGGPVWTTNNYVFGPSRGGTSFLLTLESA